MLKKLTVLLASVGLVLVLAAPASAYRVLDQDRANGTQTAVAKAWERNYEMVGFAIGPTRGTERLEYSLWLNCPNTNWWRSKHGYVTTDTNHAATWIYHPPNGRCTMTMKGRVADGTGGVKVVIGVG